MAESFDTAWLALREPADARARDPSLAAALIARLPPRPRLLDLGAGTGSLLRWLAPRIGGPQSWCLADGDPATVEAAFDAVADAARAAGLPVTAPSKRTLLVHAPGGAWRVEGIVADLSAMPGRLPLAGADAVVCSALLDLASRSWLAALAGALRQPFYAALSVDASARFLPPHPADRAVEHGFRRDQRRPKGLGDGAAAGPDAARLLAALFRARGFAVRTAPSPWHLGPGDGPLLAELAAGHAAAATPWLRGPARVAAADWAATRRAQAARERLSARLAHRDLLALPGGP